MHTQLELGTFRIAPLRNAFVGAWNGNKKSSSTKILEPRKICKCNSNRCLKR